MNENVNKPEAELNEAALENASGGECPTSREMYIAGSICVGCTHRSACIHKGTDLALYLHEHGLAMINYTQCPFYKR